MKVSRIVAVCITAALMLTLLCGCGVTKDPQAPENSIVCLSFPEYDWTRNILGENPAGFDLQLLVDNGADMHSYQATVNDIASIGSCALLICTGGSSEGWVLDALASSRDSALPSLIILQELQDRLLHAEDASVLQSDNREHEHAHTEDADEHVWLSLRNAEIACRAIERELSALDPDNAAVYHANLETYVEKLHALDVQYADMIAAATLDTVLIADRFPFLYLMNDYALDYCAAFSGCSADVDASFETVIRLTEKLSELNAPALLTIDGSKAEIADAVLANCPGTECRVLTLDSMQSVTRERIDGGDSYLGIMQHNFDTLRAALYPEA